MRTYSEMFFFPFLNHILSPETCLGHMYSLSVFQSRHNPLRQAELTWKSSSGLARSSHREVLQSSEPLHRPEPHKARHPGRLSRDPRGHRVPPGWPSSRLLPSRLAKASKGGGAIHDVPGMAETHNGREVLLRSTQERKGVCGVHRRVRGRQGQVHWYGTGEGGHDRQIDHFEWIFPWLR